MSSSVEVSSHVVMVCIDLNQNLKGFSIGWKIHNTLPQTISDSILHTDNTVTCAQKTMDRGGRAIARQARGHGSKSHSIHRLPTTCNSMCGRINHNVILY